MREPIYQTPSLSYLKKWDLDDDITSCVIFLSRGESEDMINGIFLKKCFFLVSKPIKPGLGFFMPTLISKKENKVQQFKLYFI